MKTPAEQFFTLPKLFPWYMAKARVAVVKAVTIPLRFSTEFFKTWTDTFRP